MLKAIVRSTALLLVLSSEAYSEAAGWPANATSNFNVEELLGVEKELSSPEEKAAFLATCLIDAETTCIERALKAGVDINAEIQGNTFLEIAIMRGDPELALRLVEAGADRSKSGRLGDPLTLAISSGNVDMIRAVAPDPAEVGTAILIVGAETGDVLLVELGLALGASAASDTFEGSPLALAISNGNREATSLLLESGASASINEGPALHVAVMTGQIEIAQLLIDAGADVNARGPRAALPLSLAAAAGDQAMIEMLLTAGADPLLRHGDETTPAQVAFALGRGQIAETLGGVQELAPVDLVGAVVEGDLTNVIAALQAGADPDTRSVDGWPVLHLAVASGLTDIARALLQAGAMVDARAIDGSNVMHLVCLIEDRAKRAAAFELLLQAGGERLWTLPDNKSRSPIVSLAACKVDLTLLSDKAVLSHVDAGGVTPAMAAVMEKNLSMLNEIEDAQEAPGNTTNFYPVNVGVTMADLARVHFKEALLLLPNDRPISFKAKLGMSKEEVRTMQASLSEWGYYRGPVDGLMGAGTNAALAEFLEHRGEELNISMVSLFQAGIRSEPLLALGSLFFAGDTCQYRFEQWDDGVTAVGCVVDASRGSDWSRNGAIHLRWPEGERELILTDDGGWNGASARRLPLQSR